MHIELEDFSENVRRFSGFADDYDRHRPPPPDALATVLTLVTNIQRPSLVVDLGSGTGLSTRYWADKAQQVIGIEPSRDMLERAIAATSAVNVSYSEGFSHQTGLTAHRAQVVTCMQSLHWMEPDKTFVEAARILRRGGVFAAIDYDWPPLTGKWLADQAWNDCYTLAGKLESAVMRERPLRRWHKDQHLERMQRSGCFRVVRETAIHHTEVGNAERYLGLLLSQGGVRDLLKAGATEAGLGIDRLRLIAAHEFGARQSRWLFTARIRFGIV